MLKTLVYGLAFCVFSSVCGYAQGDWKRHFIDDLPERSIFIEAADVDGDGHRDLIAGGWWWKNPGALDAEWKRHTIGEPLRNMSVVFDADQDGDIDIVGTQGVGSEANHQHVWARNEGNGEFTVLDNIDTGGNGDFLQGCLVADLGEGRQVLLSWHNAGGGVQAVTVPDNPSEEAWPFSTISEFTEMEDLSAGDIDRDGDLDLLLGEHWLENQNGDFARHRLGEVREGEADRNDLADINGDGRLDAIVSLENGTDVYWFEAPQDPAQPWQRHLIGTVPGQGFSADTADFDGDGDPDVVIGEHRGDENNRVLLFENRDQGATWVEHIVDSGPTNEIDHHDGTVAVDIDQDGDLDIISIGWYNPKVWVFENLSEHESGKQTQEKIGFHENAVDESAGGLACYKIDTPVATYYFEKEGAGLSSLIDQDGHDWIRFHPQPGSGAGGEYRGFPNAIHQQDGNFFHPLNQATGSSVVEVIEQGPHQVSLRATSNNQNWQARWDFYPTHCTFTMKQMPKQYQYWILYEGTPGGQYDDDDWWMTSAVREKQPLTKPHEGDIPAPEWIAFGDRQLNRSLFLLHHQDDDQTDRFYQMQKKMTVFGFGREGLDKYLTDVPRSFSIGLLEITDHESISSRMNTLLNERVN